MNWQRQVLHVAAKDIRHAWWMCAMFVVASAMLAAMAMGWPHLQGTSSGSDWSILVTIIGVSIFATVVQLDSPSRPDAFWATRPLAPTAVMAAKLVAVCALVLVPVVVCELIVLRGYTVPGAEMPRMLAESLENYGEILLIAMLIAALTPDLRAFFLVLLGLAVVWFVGGALLPSAVDFQLSSGVAGALNDVPLLCYGLVIVYQYLRRNTGRSRRIGLAAGAMGIIVAMRVGYTDSVSADARLWRWTDTVTVASARVAGDALVLRLVVPGAKSGERYDFRSERAYLSRADGRRDSVTVGATAVALNRPRTPDADSLHWLQAVAYSDSAQLDVQLTPEQLHAVASGDATLHIYGRLGAFRSRQIVTVPARRGAIAGGPRTRLQVDSVAAADEHSIMVHLATIEPLESTELSWPSYWVTDSLDFAAIRDDRHEAVQLVPHATSTGVLSLPALGPEGHSSAITLVAAGVEQQGVGARSGIGSRDAAPRIDEAWVRGARVSVTRWAVTRIQPVSLVVTGAVLARR